MAANERAASRRDLIQAASASATPHYRRSPLNHSWSFVAMEYYALVLNRTYLLTVGDDRLTGRVCRGVTAAEGGKDALTRAITRGMAVEGDLTDPASYRSDEVLAKDHRANFWIALAAIDAVIHDPRPTWGMGPYPHDGRVLVRAGRRRRKFIVLGDQSGRLIAHNLGAAARRARHATQPPPPAHPLDHDGPSPP